MTTPHTLLGPDDPAPYLEENTGGRSEFLITVDHAGRAIPTALGDLGVSESERRRHIAWDIGALGVARGLSQRLDATLIASTYSRLVIDCNRDPSVPSSMPVLSEYTPIPGNEGLAASDRERRTQEIFRPYQERIAASLDERAQRGQTTILVCQHTMTNEYKGAQREMHAAVLYNRDRRFAGAVLEALRAEGDWTIADNEPYFVSDETDYTVPVHAERRGLLHVEIEVRQDLVTTEAGQRDWADRLSRALVQARAHCLGA
jgi:predicted N-formylglutamate amidohydrolase